MADRRDAADDRSAGAGRRQGLAHPHGAHHIPLGAGGGDDIFSRLLAEELQKKFGQSFIVENRPGGGLNIGARACAEAAPDGYTICVMSSEPVIYNQFLFKNMPFNPEKDFEPITNLFINSGGARRQRQAQHQEHSGDGRAGEGATRHAELRHVLVRAGAVHGEAEEARDIDIVRVPFRSGNEIVNAIMSGTAPIAFLGLANMLPQIRSGQSPASRSTPIPVRRCSPTCRR